MKIMGKYRIKRNGRLIHTGRNLITHIGLAQFSLLASGQGGTAPTHIAGGDSAQEPTQEDTALIGTEILRPAATVSVVGPSFTLDATFAGFGVAGTLREFGIFNAATLGDMVARFVTPDISYITSDSIGVEWTATFRWESIDG